MLMLASATQKEVESVSDNIEQLSKDVSKLSQIGSDLIDKAVAFGIDIIIAVIIFVIGKFIIKFILKFVDRIFAKSSADEGVAKFIHSVFENCELLKKDKGFYVYCATKKDTKTKEDF